MERVWEDHLAYGDMLLYAVYPQQINTLGIRAVAVIAAIQAPEALGPSSRCTLVIEQSANPTLARSNPYTARLVSETSGT